MSASATPQHPNPGIPEGYELSKKKKPWFKRPGCIAPLAIVALIVVGVGAMSGGDSDSGSTTSETTASAPANIADNPSPVEEAAEDQAAEESDDVPTEHRSALRQADTYANTMHMSERGLYDQLTSEYGGQFSPEAAQYAVDNVETDWNENALEKARSYQDSMAMSPSAIYDQLVSDYGEKFTPEQAQYAVDNL